MLRFILKTENKCAKATGCSFFFVLTNSNLETRCLKLPFIQPVYSIICCCNAVIHRVCCDIDTYSGLNEDYRCWRSTDTLQLFFRRSLFCNLVCCLLKAGLETTGEMPHSEPGQI